MMDNYYDIPALSASGINAFMKSPLHFWRESPFNPHKKTKEDTAAMLLGKVAHKMVLEEESFSKEYIYTPPCDRRTKEGKLIYEAFRRESLDKCIITAETYAEALSLYQAMKRNTAVNCLLADGESEKPMFWQNGLLCKAKLDRYKNGLLIDYKTSTSAAPEDFEKSLVNFGYHRQAAWYMDGFERIYGDRPKGFVFVVQDKTLPDAIGIYAIDEIALERGRQENETARVEIMRRLEANQWEAFPQMIVTVGLPSWYNRKYGE